MYLELSPHLFNLLAILCLFVASLLRLRKSISSLLHSGESERVWLHRCHRLIERVVHFWSRHATNGARRGHAPRNDRGTWQLLLKKLRGLLRRKEIKEIHMGMASVEKSGDGGGQVSIWPPGWLRT